MTSQPHGSGRPNAATDAQQLARVEAKIDRVHQDVITLAQAIRDGFARVDERFTRVDGRFDEVVDIVSRIYEEHGNRLKDIEELLTRDTHA